MKQINFTGSENVVNRTSPEKFFILGDHTCVNYAAFFDCRNTQKNRFNSKKQGSCNSFKFFNKYFEAMPKEISTKINN